MQVADRKVKKLKDLICTESNGVEVDLALNESLIKTMKENHCLIEEQFPVGSFRRLFWDQQFKAAKTNNP